LEGEGRERGRGEGGGRGKGVEMTQILCAHMNKINIYIYTLYSA
jgi:hypothetical protein